jgi:hypothetical protein
MSTLWERWRWPVAVVAGALLVLLALMTHEEVWDWLGIQHFAPYYFIDLTAVLAAGQAWQAGRDVYLPNPYDVFGRPHVYGPWWLAGGPLGLTTNDARWLGPLLVLAFFLTAAAVLAPRRPGTALVALLLLASPPVLYGVERGNNDLVVFLLFAAAGALLAGRVALAGAGLFGLAAALKIYPLAALPALAARTGSRRSVLTWIGVTTVGCLLVFILWRADFTRAMAIAPRPETIFAYGWRMLPLVWTTMPHLRGPLLCASLPVLALAAWWVAWQRRTLLAAVPRTGAVAAWFVAGALAWLFCWAVNTNYSYRAVLLLLPAALWLRQSDDAARGAVARVQLAACVLVFWLWPIKSWWADSLLRGGPAGSDRWLLVTFGLEQAMVIGLNAALALGVAGWLWRRWRVPEGACAGAADADE